MCIVTLIHYKCGSQRGLGRVPAVSRLGKGPWTTQNRHAEAPHSMANSNTPPDRYGLVGHPVEHSRSPLIHTVFARQTGQRLTYELIDAAPAGVRNGRARLRRGRRQRA